MPSISNLKPETRFFGLFVGRSGDGKTFAEVSFPKPMLIFDFDLRIRGALAAKSIVPDFDQIEYEPFPPSRPLKDFFDILNLLEIQYASRSAKYKTIVLDSLTSNSRFFISDIIKLTGGRVIGGQEIVSGGEKKTVGGIRVIGPPDHNIKDQAIYQVFDFLRSFPCNVIVSAHVTQKWGKVPGSEYETTVIGEELSVTHKLAENLLTYFDEVYRFYRQEQPDGKIRYFVKFRSEIAKTCYPTLPDGLVDITNTNFYEFWKSKVGGENAG